MEAKRALARAAAVVMLVLWGVVGAWGADTVAVVLSRDLPAYQAARNGFAATIKERQPGLKLHYLDASQTRSLAAVVKAKGANLVFAIGTEAAQALKSCGLPMVFVMVVDPAQAGLSGNCTGVTLKVPVSEQFRLIKATLPKAREVGVLYNPARSGSIVREGQAAAASYGLHLRCIEVASESDLPRAAEKVKGVNLIWATLDATVYGSHSAKYVLQFALRNSIPVMGFSPNIVEAGALFAAYPDFTDIGRQGAGLVLRVLSGEPAGAIPVAAPSRVATAVNLRVAESLHISLPAAFTRQADVRYQ